MQNTVLHIADVHKSFGGLKALSDVDLEVVEGTTHAIIGPNGAGKSTLLNVCIGRIPPDTGAVVFDGEVLTGKKPYEINQLGVVRVFQTPEIFPDLSLIQNVMVPAFAKRGGAFRFNAWQMASGRSEGARAERWLEDVGLYRQRRCWPAACRAATSGGWNWRWRSSRPRGFSCSTSRRPACRATTPTR